MKPSPDVARPPRLALAMATGFGLGYLPIAPGTWGSLGGALLLASVYALLPLFHTWLVELLLVLFVSGLGVQAAGEAATFCAKQDPPEVVIDEVSGQMLGLFLGLSIISSPYHAMSDVVIERNMPAGFAALNWKYLLLGFILFRVFDIWKPFPARQAERLPGGWGIMADDWVAGIYAALGLGLARALGL